MGWKATGKNQYSEALSGSTRHFARLLGNIFIDRDNLDKHLKQPDTSEGEFIVNVN